MLDILFFIHFSYTVILRCRGFHLFSLDFTQSVGYLGRVIGPSQGLYLNTRKHKHRLNAHTHTKHPCFSDIQPWITVSERAKTVHALDCAATVTG
jgi:hypothetical protein